MRIFFSLKYSAQLAQLKLSKRCYISVATGYGHIAEKIKEGLEALGHEIVEDVSEAKSCDLEFYIGQPTFKESPVIRPAVILTMFETTRCPEFWIESINKYDLMINPSEWGRKCFKEQGVEIPIEVIPLGFDPDRFPVMHRPERETWTFYWQGLALHDRKGFKWVLEAFKQLNLPKSRLIAKVIPLAKPGTVFELKIYPVYEEQRWEEIRIVNARLSWEEMRRLLFEADVSCYPSSGEGFGLLPLEHMATGLPVILTNYSGMAQQCNPEVNFPLDYEEVFSGYAGTGGKCARPNFEQLKEFMLWTYENREAAREKGLKAAEWVRERFTWDKLIPLYEQALKEVL